MTHTVDLRRSSVKFVLCFLRILVYFKLLNESLIKTYLEELLWYCFKFFSWAPSRKVVTKFLGILCLFCYLTTLEWYVITGSKSFREYLSEKRLCHTVHFPYMTKHGEQDIHTIKNRFLGEDVSFRCRPKFNISELVGDQVSGVHVRWFKKTDQGDELVNEKRTKTIETITDNDRNLIISQLNIVNISQENFGMFYCSIYKQFKITVQRFLLRKTSPSFGKLHVLPGSFMLYTVSFNILESEIYGEWLTGFEVNGRDYTELKNKTGRCSVWIQHVNPAWLVGMNMLSVQITNSGLLSDRKPLSDLDQATRIKQTIVSCMVEDFYGVYQFYLDRKVTRKNSTVRIYHPRTLLFKPSGADCNSNGFNTSGNQSDMSIIETLKNELKEDYKEGSFIYQNIKASINRPYVKWYVFIFTGLMLNLLISCYLFEILFYIARVCTVEEAENRVEVCTARVCTVEEAEHRVEVYKTNDVFILCSDDDVEIMKRHILDPLESKGLRVWVRQRDSIPGHPIFESLSNAIDDSRDFVILITSNFDKEDEHFLNEIAQLVVNGHILAKPILVIDNNAHERHRRLLKAFPCKKAIHLRYI